MESWCCPHPHPCKGVSNYWGVIRLLCRDKSSAYSLHDCWALSTTAMLALYLRDGGDMWNCVYLASSHTEEDKIRVRVTWSFLANQVVKSLWEVSLQCPHLSQRSLGCKSAMTLLQPLKYTWCLQWDCISWALKRLYGDDKMHTTTCA